MLLLVVQFRGKAGENEWLAALRKHDDMMLAPNQVGASKLFASSPPPTGDLLMHFKV